MSSATSVLPRTPVGLTHGGLAPLPQTGVIRLDEVGRVLAIDAASARLVARSESCIGRDWRLMFPDMRSPALEFAVARRGATGAVDAWIAGRKLRVRVHESEGGALLVWHESAETTGPDREPSDRICFFSLWVEPDDMFIFDVLDAAGERATGRRTEDVRGLAPHAVLPREAADHVTERYRTCVEAGRSIRYEEVLAMPGGPRRWKTTLVPVRDPETGRIHRLIGRARDITDRHPAVRSSARLPATLQPILDSLSTQILMLDGDGMVVAVNAAWQAHDVTCFRLGENYLAACRGDDPRSGEIVTDLAAMLRDEREELRLDYPFGQRWFQLHATMLDTGDSRFLVLVCEDVTEVKRHGEALRQLPRKLLRIRDEERRRISRELHDSTAQNLVGASLAMERTMRMGLRLPRPARDALGEAQGLIQQSLREIRTLSYLLHPPMLDEAGLPHALSWYVDGVARRSNLTIDLRVGTGLPRRLSPNEAETALFRIAQEAVANAHRHSGGSRIDIGLALEDGPLGSEVVLTVSDDGVGPSPAVLRALASPSFSQRGLGVGLAGMRERLAELGGRLTVRPGRLGGTDLQAAIPLAAGA